MFFFYIYIYIYIEVYIYIYTVYIYIYIYIYKEVSFAHKAAFISKTVISWSIITYIKIIDLM